MTVSICLGSACHVKGSHFVLEQLKALIKENNFRTALSAMTYQINVHCVFSSLSFP